MGNCIYTTETFDSVHKKNNGEIPNFTVLDVCDLIPKANRIDTQIDILTGRLDFIDYALHRFQYQKPNQVSTLMKTNDCLMHHVNRSRDNVNKLQLELREVLEGKQTIELAIAKSDVKDIRQMECLLCEQASSNSNLKENTHNQMLMNLLESLPDPGDLAAKYEMQNSVMISLLCIVVAIGDKSEELFKEIKMLEKQLINEGSIHDCPSDSYKEPGEIRILDFDYYSYSSIAPIVPPLDFSWIKDKQANVSRPVQILNSRFRIYPARVLTNFYRNLICSGSNIKCSTGYENDFTSMQSGSTNFVHNSPDVMSRISVADNASVQPYTGSLQPDHESSIRATIVKKSKSIKQRLVGIFRRRNNKIYNNNV